MRMNERQTEKENERKRGIIRKEEENEGDKKGKTKWLLGKEINQIYAYMNLTK